MTNRPSLLFLMIRSVRRASWLISCARLAMRYCVDHAFLDLLHRSLQAVPERTRYRFDNHHAERPVMPAAADELGLHIIHCLVHLKDALSQLWDSHIFN